MPFPDFRHHETIPSRRISSMPPPCYPRTSGSGSETGNERIKEEFDPEVARLCAGNYAPELPLCKVIVLGDVAVGKTSLVNRFSHRSFCSNYKQTIGVDFQVGRFDILSVPFHLQIWDTAGQERFKCIAQAYYRKAHVIMLVFDLTDLATLPRCATWYQEAMRLNYDSPLIFLVGSKADKLNPTDFPKAAREALALAQKFGAEFWTVSSSTGQRVDSLMRRVAALAFQNLILNLKAPKNEELRLGCDIQALVDKVDGRSRVKCNGCSQLPSG